LLHGAIAAQEASETARKTFEEGESASGLPTVLIDLSQDFGILNAIVSAGLASSNGEAKRAIQGGAIKVNDVAVTDERLLLSVKDLNAEGAIKLSMGKKKHVLLKQQA
jgi:tyrosyl-tRNA synthetase